MEGYLPRSLEVSGTEFVDALLPLHGYLNAYYYIPILSDFDISLLGGGVLSLQNMDHLNLASNELSMSIGFQFGLGFNYANFNAGYIEFLIMNGRLKQQPKK